MIKRRTFKLAKPKPIHQTMARLVATISLFATLLVLAQGAPQAAAPAQAAAATAAMPPVIEPVIDWGKCSQLAPTEQQRKVKTDIIKACLDANPLSTKPEELSAEIVEKHRIKLGECALNKEDWFNADKSYKYDKAEEELKKKDVEASIKTKILDQHKQCKQQALEKFAAASAIIEQVQFYQSCMDFHVSQLCNIKIMLPQ